MPLRMQLRKCSNEACPHAGSLMEAIASTTALKWTNPH